MLCFLALKHRLAYSALKLSAPVSAIYCPGPYPAATVLGLHFYAGRVGVEQGSEVLALLELDFRGEERKPVRELMLKVGEGWRDG